MKAEHYSRIVRAGVGLGLAGLLAGCAGGPSWGAWSQRPTDAEVAAVLARTEGSQVAQQPEPRQEPTTVVASASER
jgi:hypothetical protein